MLKGGSGLLIRLPGARHSEDIDLLDARGDLNVALDELRALCQHAASNPFRYTLTPVDPMTGHAEGTSVKVIASMAAAVFDRFSVDLSVQPTFDGIIDRQVPTPILTLGDVDPRPHPSRSTRFPPKSPTRWPRCSSATAPPPLPPPPATATSSTSS